MKLKNIVQCMKEKFKRIFLILEGVIFLLFSSGCSQVDTQSDLYQHIKNQTEQFSQQTINQGKYTLVELAYYITNKLKSTAPFIIIGSIVLGVIFLTLVQKDQATRKRIIIIFIIGIPVVDLVAILGMAFLASALS